MPVAVPTGDYELTATLDLTPRFGKYEVTKKLRIEQPPADILERRLAELVSKEVESRRKAAEDLLWFPKAGDRAGPALLKALDDEDEQVRSHALGGLARFPKTVAANVDRFAALARGGKDIGTFERIQAAWLLARYAPPTAAIEKLLTGLTKDVDAEVAETAKYTLTIYRDRTGKKEGAVEER